MQIAALYDIHGNLPALEAVLTEIDPLRIDRLVIGGDVMPGPMPRETLLRLLKLDLPIHFLAGNGELAVLAEAEGQDCGVAEPHRRGIQWNAAQLTTRELTLLRMWPQTSSPAHTALREILFCHATPHNPNDLITRLTPDAEMAAIFAETGPISLFVATPTCNLFERSAIYPSRGRHLRGEQCPGTTVGETNAQRL